MSVAEDLCQRGFYVSLDYLGENTASTQESVVNTNCYIDMVDRIRESAHKESINISIKLTQCGLDQGTEVAEANFRRLLEAAKTDAIFVRADMESSTYTQRTIDMIERVLPDFPLTGTVLQSYLKRSMDDTKLMVRLRARVRVVKGAYLEPAEVAFQSKSDVDEQFVEMSALLMREGNYPAFATHDSAIIDRLRSFAENWQISKENFEFQMLYGIRRDLQDSLLASGYRVRVYVPYGDQWYPYFSRRLAERPANALFLLKALFRR